MKCLQFERSEKYLILPERIDLLRKKLHDFPRHRFNVNYTRNLWNQVEEHLNEKMIVKIQDFSENYTCLLPHEVQSMHWTQNQCTVYPVVVLRKVDGEIREHHFIIISDDLKHDVPFVELANIRIHEHYLQRNLFFEVDIEFNDGCASQYKSKTALHKIAMRNMLTIRVFFETLHGKSKSDGLGGVIKSYVSREVAANEVIIRNGKEMFDLCVSKLTVHDNDNEKMLSRHFVWISAEEVDAFKSNLQSSDVRKVNGIRKLHQIVTKKRMSCWNFYKRFCLLMS